MAAPARVHPAGPSAYRVPTTGPEPPRTFRARLHACCLRRADALFELSDALLCAPAVTCVAQPSLEPAHRRGWGSAYDALASGRIDAQRLRDLLVATLPSADPAEPLVFAVDVSTWPRCDVECSPARGYYYHPSRHSAGQPIIAGWAYQWICQLGAVAVVGRSPRLRAGLGACLAGLRPQVRLRAHAAVL